MKFWANKISVFFILWIYKDIQDFKYLAYDELKGHDASHSECVPLAQKREQKGQVPKLADLKTGTLKSQIKTTSNNPSIPVS